MSTDIKFLPSKNLPFQFDPKYLLPPKKLNDTIREISKKFSLAISEVNSLSLKDRASKQQLCFDTVVNCCENDNWTAIAELKQFIIELIDLQGHSLIAYFIEKENLQHVTKLKEAFPSCIEQPLQTALKLSKGDAFIQTLIDTELGKKVDYLIGQPLPIHIAVKKNRSPFIEQLIPKFRGNAVAPIHYYSKKRKLQLSLVALAVVKGHIESLDEIFKLGIEIFSAIRVGNQKWSLLHLAVHGNQINMLKHLFNNYACEIKCLLNVPDEEGKTPLMLAALSGNVEAVEVLIKEGADLEKCDFYQKTAMSYAILQRHKLIINLLANKRPNLMCNLLDLNELIDAKSIERDEFTEKLRSDFNNLQYLQNRYKGNFYLNPPENVCLQGGGAKGITFGGAARGLEKCDMLKGVIRLGGTSVGAITATLLALGYNAERIKTFSSYY